MHLTEPLNQSNQPMYSAQHGSSVSTAGRSTEIQDENGAGSGPLTDRPALDEAHIRLRKQGRELVIDVGKSANDHEDRPQTTNPGSEEGAPAVSDQTIPGFSENARRRLRKRIHSMDRRAEGIFLTLTYHETRPTPEECKRHLDRFWKRVRRQFSGVSAIWKMEPQERGVPHFHLMVYGVQFIPIEWLSAVWHDVTEETSGEHRASGVDLERFVNEDGKLQAYMGKYMAETYDRWPGAEEGDPWAETGRWWGCLGREYLPWADWDNEAVYIDPEEAKYLIRTLLDEWGVDIPDGVVPNSLSICTRGDPAERLDALLEDRLGWV